VDPIHVVKSANEPPAACQLAHGQNEFISALSQRQVYSVVFRINDAEKSRVAEALRTPAPVQDLII
jgi:hypothetical protein